VHLLVSVFITPTGLASYNTGRIKKGDFFRVGRFLSSIQSLTKVDFDSTRFYVEIDPIWFPQSIEIYTLLSQFFPYGEIYKHRLKTVSEWEEVSRLYSETDVVLLQTNDDHYLLQSGLKELDYLENVLASNDSIKQAGITHFPEMFGLSMSSDSYFSLTHERYLHLTTGSVGTVLIKGELFKSWWRNDPKLYAEKIVRPDNPFGKPIQFEPSLMVIPHTEIFRHMDGYSHILLFRPLAPLRNVLELHAATRDYIEGYWPIRLHSFSNSDIDLHKVGLSDEVGLLKIRVGVARLQAAWALRINLLSLSHVLPSCEFTKSQRVSVLLVALFTRPILKNILDLFMDSMVLVLNSALILLRLPRIKLGKRIEYLGWARAGIELTQKDYFGILIFFKYAASGTLNYVSRISPDISNFVTKVRLKLK
jgi:hypothetical protein